MPMDSLTDVKISNGPAIETARNKISTRGFAAKEELGVAVCLLAGTELAFEHDGLVAPEPMRTHYC
ncbi:MAG: hypothetical protein QOE55_8409 [Acidobacteriaceae bacterium]|nr:hypothetical protein [Acidobacteriaceae bacterium]